MSKKAFPKPQGKGHKIATDVRVEVALFAERKNRHRDIGYQNAGVKYMEARLGQLGRGWKEGEE